MPYNFNAKCAFLTFSRDDTTRLLVIARAQAKWPTLDWIVVARETHNLEPVLDAQLVIQTPFHLHVLLHWSAKKHFRTATWADFLGQNHPNIKIAPTPKDQARIMTYITKEDTTPEEWPTSTIIDVIAATAPKSVQISRMIHAHLPLSEIDRAIPGFLVLHLPAVQRYQEFVRANELAIEPLERPAILTSSADPAVISIAEWCTDAITIAAARPFKSAQLWVTAQSNFGKSMLFDILSTSFRVYTPSMNSDFWPNYRDDAYDVVIWDEFSGSHCKFQFLNRLLEGRQVRMKYYGSQVIKNKNIPCVILSNKSPIECYPNCDVTPLMNRLLVCNPGEPFGESLCAVVL